MHYCTKNIALKGLTGVLSLVLLMAVGQCRGPVEGGRGNPPGEPNETEKPNERNTEARLSLQVENLVGDKKLKAYLVNTSAQEVDLKPYKIDVKVATVTDVRDQELAGGFISVQLKSFTGNVSMEKEHGGVVADLIGFTKGQKKLGAEEKVELEGLQLDLPPEAVAAQVVLGVNNPQGAEEIEQKLTWMSGITIAIAEKATLEHSDESDIRLYFEATIENRAAAPLVLKELNYKFELFTKAGTDTGIGDIDWSGLQFMCLYDKRNQDKTLTKNEAVNYRLRCPIHDEALIAGQEVYVRLTITDEKGKLLNVGVQQLAITKR